MPWTRSGTTSHGRVLIQGWPQAGRPGAPVRGGEKWPRVGDRPVRYHGTFTLRIVEGQGAVVYKDSVEERVVPLLNVAHAHGQNSKL